MDRHSSSNRFVFNDCYSNLLEGWVAGCVSGLVLVLVWSAGTYRLPDYGVRTFPILAADWTWIQGSLALFNVRRLLASNTTWISLAKLTLVYLTLAK